ncbi:MAG: hypothetical protein ACOX1P_03990 [Thermoguttaceae bacterium]|jgi:hypothetical protein
MVKHRLIIVAISSIWLASSLAGGQEKTSKLDALNENYMVGSWATDGTYFGKPFKGTLSARPGAGGSCLIYSWTFRTTGDEPIRGTAVGGLDPKTGQFVEYCFESDGSHFVSRYPGEAFPDTFVGYGERSGIMKGKEYAGKITVDRKNRDHFIYTVASEDTVALTMDCQRVKESTGKPKGKKK